MMKILVPVDGSECSLRAVEYMIKQAGLLRDGADPHLLSVQHPLPEHVAAAAGHGNVATYHREQGEQALAQARQKLDAAGVKYTHHIVLGEAPDAIAQFAREQNCDIIVMGTRGLGRMTNMLLGSVATKVIHLTEKPVLLVK